PVGGLRSGVGDEHAVDGGQVGRVIANVGGRAEDSLLFAAEEDEAHGAARCAAAGLDGARNLDDRGGSGAVVLRAGGRVPGVEMAGDDDDLVGEIAAGDLGDNVVYFDVVADMVFVGELDPDGAVVEHALDQRGVFCADL